ncbi:MotA/TolQ/ExbB proton channel family protein [Runella sp. CRIBMP]|uniref:MotA/TolQ/ExbB proton channel family protein n=1 Tax=Runella salmonicolor TaxID=2950278 RepID=A0ABT1FQ88_9BACT|nr:MULTISPECIES: MotA/TolQ/ExbB proton channel family protein [Runella]MCP1383660.1 MotA/TolQ/ExbB proton channel family protein [Runella salmonicolor]NBB17864.1 MotA/TolQ/ExbB proton channel family protein [Runella sp. CRIBMP]
MEKKATSPAPAKAAAPKKSAGGLNPILVIPVLLVIAYLVYQYICGDPSHFVDGDHEKGPKSGDYFGIVYEGGPIVPLLFTCFLTVLVFSIERFFILGRANGSGSIDEFVRKVKSLLDKNEIEAAIKECDKQKGSVGNVVKTALHKFIELRTETELTKDQKLAALQKEVEEATSLELPMLEKNLTIIATLASVSTLTALLGTVLGMIRAFAAMGNTGAPDTGALATGISEALVNTALGIGTAAIATIMYSYFTSRIDTLTYKIDEIGLSIQQNFSAHN